MKKPLILLLTGMFAIVAFAFSPLSPGYKPGDKAIDFKLKNVDGTMLSMADDNKAKGFIISFTCNACPYSKMYEQRIIDLHKKFAPKGYPVVAINPNDASQVPDDSFDEMKKIAKSKKYPFAYLVDETQEIAKTYGATNTPHIYVLQRQENGDLIVKYVGAIDNNTKDGNKAEKKYVEEAVNALLEGKDVPTETAKAIGCTIKWK